MDLHQRIEQDLEEHINKDLELKKKLEDKLRCEDDPKEKAKLKNDIQDIDSTVADRRSQLKNLFKERQDREALARQMPDITFDELEIVTKSIICIPPAPPETNFTLTNPKEKMSKNKFTDKVLFPLTMGMGKVWEVNRFVETFATLNPDFPERLRAGFIREYERLRAEGVEGDALFEALCNFSSCHSTDIRKVAAGLAVLSYLFWKCEVFER
ncbi:hypothetical protein NDI39_15425 [Microcoleus sp. ZQ-A2]|nr:hypothetical protein [Microcoleus sp. FACHB-1]